MDGEAPGQHGIHANHVLWAEWHILWAVGILGAGKGKAGGVAAVFEGPEDAYWSGNMRGSLVRWRLVFDPFPGDGGSLHRRIEVNNDTVLISHRISITCLIEIGVHGRRKHAIDTV